MKAFVFLFIRRQVMIPNIKQEEQLLESSLSGDKDSFGVIVQRYQSLICSIAYCATGDIGKSEELAQETFITAWKKLEQLKELSKFRAWLCAIARNLARKSIAEQHRDMISDYQTLEEVSEVKLTAPGPSETAISKEQQEIVWAALKEIPEKYREPMVIFYREQQSIREVATELELSEDAAKQRLVRGRKMLKKQVAAIVEETLGRTRPGEVFTVAVIAALPALTPQAVGAAIGAAAAKGTVAAKFASLLQLGGGVLGPLLGLLGAIIGMRASIRDTRSPRERKFQKKVVWIGILWGATLPLYLTLLFLVRSFTRIRPSKWRAVFILVYLAGVFVLAFIFARQRKKIQVEESTYLEPEKRMKERSAGAIYGAFSGAISGSLLWLYLTAWKAKDWIALSMIIASGILIFLISTKWCLKVKEKYNKIAAATFLLIGLVNLVVINLRWKSWIKYFSESGRSLKYTRISLRQMNLLIVSVIAIILFIIVVLDIIERSKMKQQGSIK